MESNMLFKLKNGWTVTNEKHSDVLSYLKEHHPETPYQEDSTGYTWDEAGIADLFSECYDNDTRYCPEKKSWYTYDNGAWKKDTQGLLVSAKLKEFVRLLSLYCGEIEDDDRRKDYMKFVAKLGDRRMRDRILRDAEDSMKISAETFDKNPYLINCLNGTYDLKTGRFREHSYADYLTMQTRFEYTVRPKKCERWETFIDEVTQGDKEKAAFIKRSLGYSIIGTSKEECLFILYGSTTRNGKSTLLRAVEYMLGDYSEASDVAIICKRDRQKDADAPSSLLAALKGKRFVTMAEPDSNSRLNVAAIKQFTGGESITARALYEKPITYVPQFTLWISCNDLPAVQDKSLFASERVKVIEFNRHFTEAEQDKTLKEYFESNEAMIGIFAWLIEGYREYRKYGLKMPECVRQTVKRYEKDNDLVVQFLEERCERAEDVKTQAKTLYDTYKVWCKSNGYYVCSSKKFNAEVTAHPEWYEEKRKSTGGMYAYIGIRLKE